MIALSPDAAALYDRINAANSPDELDALSCIIWGRYGADESQFLTEVLHSRKPRRASMAPQPLAKLRGPVSSRFSPRPCRTRLTSEQRAKRRERKRILGGSSAMPDTMRHHYTEGERALLCIIAFEVKRQGRCTLSIDEIGDRAGVGRTTVQNALHQARLLRHVEIIERPQRGAKNLTNIIRVISAAWLKWIKRAPSAAARLPDRVQISKNVSTTESIDLRKEEALQEGRLDKVLFQTCSVSEQVCSREGTGMPSDTLITNGA